MGDVIDMAGHRRARAAAIEGRDFGGARGAASFYFDLASPYTYLAAERVGRLFGAVRWVPVLADAVQGGASVIDAAELDELRADVEGRATELRMPLVWPDRMPATCQAAMRIAAHAATQDRAEPFVLAASRLAFCGGFDLNDPDILAEAAAAAGLSLDDCLQAAGDEARDGALIAGGRRLLAQGADRLPALKVHRMLFCGEERMLEAATAARGLESARPLAWPGAPTAG
jgi:2-hydroxychromene-2-carboxylate isomerase